MVGPLEQFSDGCAKVLRVRRELERIGFAFRQTGNVVMADALGKLALDLLIAHDRLQFGYDGLADHIRSEARESIGGALKGILADKSSRGREREGP